MAIKKIPVRAHFGSMNEKLKTEVESHLADHPIEPALVDNLCRPFNETGSIVTCRPVSDYPLSVVSGIEPVQEGTGDPSPDNIRPISGYGEVKLTHTGKNIFGGDALADVIASYGGTKDATAGTITYRPAFVDKITLFTKFKENTQYTFVFYGKTTGSSDARINHFNLRINYTNGTSKDFEGATPGVDEYVCITTTKGKTVKNLSGVWYSGTTTLYYDQCGIFEGVVSLEEFEAYKRETFTFDLGQTVYGGSLDWSTGLLTIGYGKMRLDNSLGWAVAGGQTDTLLPIVFQGDKYNIARKNTALCTHFARGTTDGTVGKFWIDSYPTQPFNMRFMVPKTIASSQGEWLAYIAEHDIELCYELAEPITIQLTPQEILALSGINVLYSDIGDITVSGKADYTHKLSNLLDRVAALEASAVSNT